MEKKKKKAGKGQSAPNVVVTPPFILSFADLWEVSTMSGEYEITGIFDESKVDISGLRENLKAAATELWGDKVPKRLHSPIQKGEDVNEERAGRGKEPFDSYEGNLIIKAKSQSQPEVRDLEGNLIMDPAEVYSGCLCRAIFHGYAYDNDFKVGVRFNLVSVQKLRDGKRLGGGKKVNSEKEYTEAGDADLSNFDDIDSYGDPDDCPF